MSHNYFYFLSSWRAQVYFIFYQLDTYLISMVLKTQITTITHIVFSQMYINTRIYEFLLYYCAFHIQAYFIFGAAVQSLPVVSCWSATDETRSAIQHQYLYDSNKAYYTVDYNKHGSRCWSVIIIKYITVDLC